MAVECLIGILSSIPLFEISVLHFSISMSRTNAAIVIAVSEYKNANRLLASKNDGILMRDVLQQTGKFPPENIFVADHQTDSATVKTGLAAFIKELETKPDDIDEVFFYFTGHGLSVNGDFFFIFSDFDPKKLNQTTLSNTELDGMLRTLSSELAVKVVDACQSGSQYIKSSDELEKTLKQKSQPHFKSCYFMFSSEEAQSSWQDDRLSYFTRSFLSAVHEGGAHPVRYKDIISYIADEFEGNTLQKPVFVAQGGFTEIFTQPVQSLSDLLANSSGLLSKTQHIALAATVTVRSAATATATVLSPTVTVGTDMSDEDEIERRLLEAAKDYHNEEQANAVYAAIQSEIEAWQLSQLCDRFYTVNATFLKDTYSVPYAVEIAQWFEKNNGDYFVDLEYVTRRKWADDPMFPGMTFGRTSYEIQELKSFDTTVKMPPYRSVHVTATPRPKFPTLSQCIHYVAFIASRSELRCFYATAEYVDENWKERRMVSGISWRSKGLSLSDKEQIKPFVETIMSDLTTALEAKLMAYVAENKQQKE